MPDAAPVAPPTATHDRAYVEVDLPLPDRRVGKVRVSYSLPGRPDERLFVTTDRLSAFDRIITGVPYKGQVLNQLAAWWFEQTDDIVANHVISLPDPNVLVARSAQPLPVEVIVRGHITGVTSTSLWKRYADGERTIYGYTFPEGLQKNTELPAPIITPTTKAEAGAHDEALTCADVTDKGYVEPQLWDRVQAAALAVFERGRELARDAGLILADTKYEFGLGPDGELLLIDEVHTPDSSRFWESASYEDRLAAGEEPESLDKEVIRRALADAGYSGDGDPPQLDPSVWTETTRRYQLAYERLTGVTFEPASYPPGPRIETALRGEGLL
jgi:phosphoribosylaminoimidazole-succinocarboxamide synthase